MVLIGSRILIPAVEETAFRLNIPDAIIAATLVAFGTSLPELVTAITAVRKGHGELAIGNVLGADVLNVLFVSGAAAAVTKGGLYVPPQFFYLFFPSMIFVVIILRVGIHRASGQFSKTFGFILLIAYIITIVLGYVVPGTSPVEMQNQPRPMKGIFVAITLMNCTLASNGRLAMNMIALATFTTSIVGSGRLDPSGCGTPPDILAVLVVAALPISIWLQAISY